MTRSIPRSNAIPARLGVTVLLALTASLPACAQPRPDESGAQAAETSAQPDEARIRAMLAKWPADAQTAAADMMTKYGPPQEVTASLLIWRNNGPWKYTMISNYETQHDFPVPHHDVMEQGIDYSVSPDKVDDLAMYDGSVTIDRSQGQIAARCDKEGANFLALNLANDVATGSKTVAGARDYYAKAIDGFMKTGRMDPYMQRLTFAPKANSGFRDRPAPMAK